MIFGGRCWPGRTESRPNPRAPAASSETRVAMFAGGRSASVLLAIPVLYVVFFGSPDLGILQSAVKLY